MNQGPIGVDVDPLHQTGRTISGRSDDAGSSANKLELTLSDASGKVGHGSVVTAMTNYVQGSVQPHTKKLPGIVDAAGVSTSNVAGVANNSDVEAAREINQVTQENDGNNKRIGGMITPT